MNKMPTPCFPAIAFSETEISYCESEAQFASVYPRALEHFVKMQIVDSNGNIWMVEIKGIDRPKLHWLTSRVYTSKIKLTLDFRLEPRISINVFKSILIGKLNLIKSWTVLADGIIDETGQVETNRAIKKIAVADSLSSIMEILKNNTIYNK